MLNWKNVENDTGETNEKDHEDDRTALRHCFYYKDEQKILQMVSAKLEVKIEIQESKQIQLLSDIKERIKASQYRALLNVNEQLIRLYWDIGNDLNQNMAYGNRFIDTLA